MNNIRKMWRLIWAICRFRNNNDEAEQAHSARSLHCGVALRQCVNYGMRWAGDEFWEVPVNLQLNCSARWAVTPVGSMVNRCVILLQRN